MNFVINKVLVFVNEIPEKLSYVRLRHLTPKILPKASISLGQHENLDMMILTIIELNYTVPSTEFDQICPIRLHSSRQGTTTTLDPGSLT